MFQLFVPCKIPYSFEIKKFMFVLCQIFFGLLCDLEFETTFVQVLSQEFESSFYFLMGVFKLANCILLFSSTVKSFITYTRNRDQWAFRIFLSINRKLDNKHDDP